MSATPPNVRPSPEVVRAKQHEIARRYDRRKRGAFNGNARKAVRRREIERYMAVADAECLNRCLIAWVGHLPRSANPLQAVLNCASRLGLKITPGDASSILEEASLTGPHLKADNLGRFLGLTYQQRTILRITTIGACDFSKAQRTRQRKHKDRLYQERRRRDQGARPQSESLSATQPWRELGMSRTTWYRRKKHLTSAVETTSSAAFFLGEGEDESVSTKEGIRAGLRPEEREARGLSSSRTATTIAADVPISRVPHWCFGLRPMPMARAA
jgi:hypothetical protein